MLTSDKGRAEKRVKSHRAANDHYTGVEQHSAEFDLNVCRTDMRCKCTANARQSREDGLDAVGSWELGGEHEIAITSDIFQGFRFTSKGDRRQL
jgi:hypothetical protein